MQFLPSSCRCRASELGRKRLKASPGISTGSNTKGIAAEAATASGSAPLSMSLYCPSLDTTPTANSCMHGVVCLRVWLRKGAFAGIDYGAGTIHRIWQDWST